jgi:flagellar motor switch protein FliM
MADRVRTIDFSRPTKFSADQQRRITRAAEFFCQTANTRLSSELRHPIELEVTSSRQLTWSATQARVPVGSLQATLEVEPIGTRMLFTLEESFVAVCLECLLGGTPERPAPGRRLSEIDWTLARGLVGSLVQPLSQVWEELAGVTLRVSEIGQGETTQLASVSEPTFSLEVEARLHNEAYTLGLLIPWAAIEPVEVAVGGAERQEDDDRFAIGPMQGPMAAVPVTLRAEVAATELLVEEILALGPGSVIEFAATAEDGVEVYVDNVSLARAQPGHHGARRAVQLHEFIQERR